MAVIETWFEQDLQKPVKVRYIDGNLFSHNGNGNRIGVIVTNNGDPVTLTGTVSGYAVLADGTTVPCTGSISGNKASILVPAAAYSPGSILISIFLTDGTTVTTLAALSSSVIMARTGNQIDPGSVVTDWTNTINAAMQSVETAAANLGNIIATPYENLPFPVPLGKYTIYNNGLYRCISPIASSEAWTAAHWTNVKLGDDVADLKSAFGELATNSVLCESGGWNWQIRAKYDNVKLIRNKQPIAISNYYSLTIPSGYELYYQAFDAEMNVINQTGWKSGEWKFTDVYAGTVFINFHIRNSSDHDADISAYVSTVQAGLILKKKSKQEIEYTNDRISGIESLFNLTPDITNTNVFIYNNDNKIYANTTNGFSLKAYRILKGKKYVCNGKSVATFNTFNYPLVYFGIVYTDSEINLNSGTSFTFGSKISVNAYTNPSDYSEAFTAENNGYVIQLVVADKFSVDSIGVDSSEIIALQNELVSVAGYQKKEIETTLMELGFEQSEFSDLNSWSISNGKLTTSTAGVTNRATVDKSFAIEDRDTVVRFSSSDPSAKIGFGYLSPAYERGSSLFYLDYTGKMAICECFSDPTAVPNDRVTKNITVATGRDYIAVLGKRKKENTFTIIDTLTGERYTISTESVSTSSLDNEFAGGRQNGFPFVVLLSGTNADVKEWYATTPFDKPLIAVYGDSITEGDRLTNKQKRYADWLKDDFGYLNISVSGMSGSTIDMTKKQIQSEISATKPKIVIVGIGTNGSVQSVTKAKYDEIIAIVEAEGATAIINHIPMLSGTESITKNAVIETVETEHCLMDVATAKNNDVSQGQNTSMFADAAHPNEKGHKAMYQRFIIDSSIYHE